jgi:hypothetical protein
MPAIGPGGFSEPSSSIYSRGHRWGDSSCDAVLHRDLGRTSYALCELAKDGHVRPWHSKPQPRDLRPALRRPLGRKRTFARTVKLVKCPIAGVSPTSFYHLVGQRRQRRWNGHLQKSGGVHIDQERQIDRSLNGKFRRFCAVRDIGGDSALGQCGCRITSLALTQA